MDFDRLAEFTAIANQKSIKKAAQELGISSATLSARLIRFEEQLGTPLFLRTADAMVLTSAGEQLLPNSIEILSEYQKLRREMHATQEHSYHQLRIAVTGNELPLYLGPFLDRLNISNPDIHLEILDDSRFGISEGILSGAADIYFAPVMDSYSPKNVSRVSMSTSNQYVILPRGHRLAERSMISMRELDGETFLLYPKTAEPAIRDFQLQNLQDSNIRYSLYDSGTAPLFYSLLIPIGKGIIIRPTHMMGLPPNAVCIPVTDLLHPATVCYFYNPATASPDTLAFIKDFSAFAKELMQREHK